MRFDKLHFLIGFLVFVFTVLACNSSEETKVQNAFLEDSLQFVQTEELKKRAVLQSEIVIDTALNNLNSEDPAVPVLD